jgi:hypothetical protein
MALLASEDKPDPLSRSQIRLDDESVVRKPDTRARRCSETRHAVARHGAPPLNRQGR